ncbi:chemotaxis-specific protein-glutamate methyltransferase CheB [Ectothiorhodospiraceae bacterium BW-2]|nr:chemotaxis-specific protein-glutamate methyltransferase CheB [Ectothiorhodospiraceae bacterium BW-2]
MTKVLIVDDSALMRKKIREILQEGGDFELDTARDGRDALEKMPQFRPDVVTLDINMPIMDGLTCLAHIMALESPPPVVMVSSLTEEGALTTFEALELGAFDYVAKPGGTVSLNIRDVEQEIVAKVKAAAKSRRRKVARGGGLRERLRQQRVEHNESSVSTSGADVKGLVVIGVSTGGPSTLEEILPLLPAAFPWPVLVAQHMPGRFTAVFARRLDGRCQMAVKEVDSPMALRPGEIYIARGDADVKIGRRKGVLMALSVPQNSALWHPCVDRMVESAMEYFSPKQLVGVQLTGMGYDGAEQMAKLHQKGGRTIAEAEESAVVFGMPKELIERGGATEVLPANKVAAQLLRWVKSP